MKSRFTLVENTGDPSHLTPMEIALSRCSWSPSEISSGASDGTQDVEAGDPTDACLSDAIGTLREDLRSIRRETRDALSKLLDAHLAPGALAASEIASRLLESDDCAMEFVDSMPSEEGLLICVLVKQNEQASGGADGVPLSAVQ